MYSIILDKQGFDTNSVKHLTNGAYSITDYKLNNDSIQFGYLHHDSIIVTSIALDSMKESKLKETLLYSELSKKEALIQQLVEENNNKKKDESSFPFFKASEQEKEAYKKEQLAEKILDTNKLKPYQLQLTSEYVVAQLDNTMLINAYQPYAQYQGLFRQAQLGGMMKYAFTDLFEDHRVTVGFRMPSTTQGSDFYIHYEHLRNRLDWGITYFRHVEKLN